MRMWRKLPSAIVFAIALALGGPNVAAQTKPEGEMRFAVYVTLAPAWLDPGEATPGFITPFWVLVALHDALVKPMPGSRMAPSLAESWTESPDKREYEFIFAQGSEISQWRAVHGRRRRVQLQSRKGCTTP